MEESSLLYSINRAGMIPEVDAGFSIVRNSSYPYCVIHFVTKGSGWVTCKNREYPVEKGQLYILNAFEAHSYRTDPKSPMGLNWIEFGGGDSHKLVRGVLSGGSPIIPADCSTSANRYIQRIIRIWHNGWPGGSILVSRLIYSLLLKLLDFSRNEPAGEIAQASAAAIRKAVDYIEDNLGEELDIGHLSKVSNFNPTYFARLFSRVTGFTPAKYVLARRVSRAKELLCSSDTRVELISEELGFCNPSHFIRLFRKAEGVTPAEYRRQSLLFRQMPG